MSIKTSDQILESLAAFIESQIKVASVNPNTILFDSFVDRLTSRLAELYADLTGVQQDQSISFADTIATSALDRLGVDWNLTRKSATAASGFAVFASLTSPISTIRIGDPDGTGGITVQTRRRPDGSVVSYTTTSTVFLLTTTPIDPETNTYRISAPILSTIVGTASNAESEEISVLKNSVPGVDLVTNPVEYRRHAIGTRGRAS
jgi:uncharacterized phage protein gp47/JayE